MSHEACQHLVKHTHTHTHTHTQVKRIIARMKADLVIEKIQAQIHKDESRVFFFYNRKNPGVDTQRRASGFFFVVKSLDRLFYTRIYRQSRLYIYLFYFFFIYIYFMSSWYFNFTSRLFYLILYTQKKKTCGGCDSRFFHYLFFLIFLHV